MLNICMTFDHEIFFGENYGTWDEILFGPTYAIMEKLACQGIKATFFNDVCAVARHQQLGMAEFPCKMAEQLKTLVSHGYDVQLHTHANWYRSDFVDGKWVFDCKSYKIHEFGFDDNKDLSVGKIIHWGKEYLENLLKPVDSDYRCLAYRAGGFSIQPEKPLFEILLKNGLIIDSSIGKNLHFLSDTLQYSFKNMPPEANWYINPALGMRVPLTNGNERIFEVPIGTLLKKPQKFIISKSNKGFSNLGQKGTYIPTNTKMLTGAKKLINRIDMAWNYPLTFSMDSYDAEALMRFTECFIKQYDCENKDCYIALIGHPKLFNETRIDSMLRYVNEVRKKYKCVTFSTMRDIANSKVFQQK